MTTPDLPKEKPSAADACKVNSKSTSTEAQIEKLIELVRFGSRHTYELRKMGISHPAGRINDLKKRGYIFAKQPINTVDSDGYTHCNVALYSLISEPEDREAV